MSGVLDGPTRALLGFRVQGSFTGSLNWSSSEDQVGIRSEVGSLQMLRAIRFHDVRARFGLLASPKRHPKYALNSTREER